MQSPLKALIMVLCVGLVAERTVLAQGQNASVGSIAYVRAWRAEIKHGERAVTTVVPIENSIRSSISGLTAFEILISLGY